MKLYVVGGAVRDHLMGRPHGDLDFAAEADSFDDMMEGLRLRGFTAWLTRPEFVSTRGYMPRNLLGNFGGLLPPATDPAMRVAVDVTLCRAEAMYSDKRHPDTVTPTDIYTDLSRRDFTVNAMARGETGGLLDPHSGAYDVGQRNLKTVGRALDRFEEDPLRMLRAVRFRVTHNLALSLEVQEGMRRAAVLLNTLPVERVQDELQKALRVSWRATMLQLLVNNPEVGMVLAAAFPNLWFKATKESK